MPNERIVTTYDTHMDETRIPVSLATVEFKPTDGSTKLVITEQGVFLDGYDDAGSRERGTCSTSSRPPSRAIPPTIDRCLR